MANPLDEYAREIKVITAKGKNKTEDDYAALAKLEFHGGIYTMGEGNGKRRVCIPGDAVHACFKNGAKAEKKGKDFDRYVFVVEMDCPLLYDGPKDIDALWEAGKFMDQRMVKVGAARVLRTRPRFDQWSIECSVEFDPSFINLDPIKRAIEQAGRACGLGDNIPRYGRFTVEFLKG